MNPYLQLLYERTCPANIKHFPRAHSFLSIMSIFKGSTKEFIIYQTCQSRTLVLIATCLHSVSVNYCDSTFIFAIKAIQLPNWFSFTGKLITQLQISTVRPETFSLDAVTEMYSGFWTRQIHRCTEFQAQNLLHLNTFLIKIEFLPSKYLLDTILNGFIGVHRQSFVPLPQV